MLKKVRKIDVDRASIWIVISIAIIVLGGGILQLRAYLFIHDRTLFEPVLEQLAASQAELEDEYFATTESGQDLERQKREDSDSDGLSDFDELYFYGTSPYLTDTDSDETGDSDEVTAGTDPTCPEGSYCDTGVSSSTGVVAEEAFADLNPDALVPRDEEDNVDIAALRNNLLQYGVPQDVLDKTDDQTLLTVFEDIIGQSESGANAVVNVKEEVAVLQNMTAEEKRAFMVEAGFKQEEVDALDEEQLNFIFDEAIKQALEEAGASEENTPALAEELEGGTLGEEAQEQETANEEEPASDTSATEETSSDTDKPLTDESERE